MNPKSNDDIVAFSSQREWAAWLKVNHATATEVWIKYARKGSTVKSITYAEAIEEALCYGWIDGQAASFDAASWLQRFTPRRKRSKWSVINCDKAIALIKRGKMKPAGLKEVEAAKADGRWESAYLSPSKITVPEDLQAALNKEPKAQAFFETLSGSNRYAILYRLHDAKKPETRQRRLEKFVTMLKEHRTFH